MSIRTTTQIAIISLIAMTLPFADARAEYHDKPVIMIVHGAWGGGWAFRDTEKALHDLGFDVRRPTLTGLGERAHLVGENVGLTTHIQDVINVLRSGADTARAIAAETIAQVRSLVGLGTDSD